MTQELKNKSEIEIMDFIRESLTLTDEEFNDLKNKYGCMCENRLRFDMTGYETKTGEITLYNQFVLNRFADLGIYDYTSYLFIDFYKGTPKIYLKYFNEEENIEIDELDGMGTRELIYIIFQLTILSERRRI